MILTRRRKLQNGSLLLEERKSGPSVWVYRYWDQQGGRRHRRKAILGTVDEIRTQDDAVRRAEPYRLIANRENPEVGAVNMEALIQRYLKTVLPPEQSTADSSVEPDEGAQMSQHCARSYRSCIKRWIKPRWTERKPGVPYLVREFEDIRMSTAIEEWLRSLLRSSRNPSGLAPKTVRGIFLVMRQVFKMATKWGYISRNPMADKLVELPRGSTLRSKRPRVLTPAEFVNILGLFDTAREKLALSLVGLLGVRISEAFGLKWRDIDFINKVVHFERGIVEGRVTPLKTEASRTDLPLPETVITLLLAWRLETPYTLDDDFIFASPAKNGKFPFWTNQMLKDHIQPVIVRAGMGKVGWHTFRHSYLAWGKASGLEAIELQKLARHQSLQTTANIYGETAVEAKRVANRRIIDYVTRDAEAAKKTEGGRVQ